MAIEMMPIVMLIGSPISHQRRRNDKRTLALAQPKGRIIPDSSPFCARIGIVDHTGCDLTGSLPMDTRKSTQLGLHPMNDGSKRYDTRVAHPPAISILSAIHHDLSVGIYDPNPRFGP